MPDQNSNQINQSIYNYLRQLAPITDDELQELMQMAQLKSYGLGDHFTRAGDSDLKFGFVVQGLFKAYYVTENGQQSIRQFALERQLLGAYSSMILRQPSNINIQALESAVVVEVCYEHFLKLYDNNFNWNLIGRKIAEHYYAIKEQREYEFLTMTASERYAQLCHSFPGLVDRTTKSNIASYLGITPVSLSRILAQTSPSQQSTL